MNLTLNNDDVAAYAAQIRGAYEGASIEPIRLAAPDATLDDAYAIQETNTRYWVEQGRTIIGAKIGLTAKSVQKRVIRGHVRI
jgi:2-keto-4-pentenoate hydratase